MDIPYPPLKRHHSHPPPPSLAPQPPPPSEIIYRILCPKTLTGGVIGKGGIVIRQLREETGAKIRLVDEFPPSHSDERVIVISSPDTRINIHSSFNPVNSEDESGKVGNGGGENVQTVKTEDVVSVAQIGLLKVFERMSKVEEGREGERKKENDGGDNVGGEFNDLGGHVICRLLAPSYQVGCVLGREGKIIESIRADSCAQIRVLPREVLPPCASPGDELIQMTGNFQSVRKALLSVSSCLLDYPSDDYPREDVIQGPGPSFPLHMDSYSPRGRVSGHHSSDFQHRGFPYASEIAHNKRIPPEDDVVFKMLCPVDKVGSLIGKGGCIIRVIENDTGASIKITDAVLLDSDEKVVVISARENWECKRSPAQDAVLRVHDRIAELGLEPGGAVTARLLVHCQQIGCLLGKGGNIITEMRRLTGANIRVFGREQGLKGGQNEEVVQVIGNLHSVKDALFQITFKLRETIFPPRVPPYNVTMSPHVHLFSELHSPSFRPRHDPGSPGQYHSPVGFSHGNDGCSPGHLPIHQPGYSQNSERVGPGGQDQIYHLKGRDKPTHGLTVDGSVSPHPWSHPQILCSANPSRFSGVRPSLGAKNGHNERNQTLMRPTIEVVIPHIFLRYIYGENSSNLSHIRQLSGAEVVVHDPVPGATEGAVSISGNPKQLHLAQSLVHAFILSGQSF